MSANDRPDIVRTAFYVTVSSNEIMQVSVNVYKPEVVGDDVVVNWDIEAYCSLQDGKMYTPSEFPVITQLLYAKLRRNKAFDPEMVYYTNCSADA